MKVEFKVYKDTLIAYLYGELDHHNAEVVRNSIDTMLDKGYKNLIFNFRGVSFMDSSGIGAVIGRYKKVNRKDGVVCITQLSEKVERIFNLSGLFKIIPFYETEEMALQNIV